MKNKLKRFQMILLTFVLVLNMIPLPVFAVTSESDFTIRNLTSTTCAIQAYVGNGGEVEIPTTINGRTVTQIEWGAFGDKNNITFIKIPESVTSIGSMAFNGCKGLTNIIIPGSVTSIGSMAFSGCAGLTNIIIPESVTSIGMYTYFGCKGLTNITIPKNVTSIGEGAFSGCEGLTNITIPEKVTSIEGSAFFNCKGLTNITIPESVTNIDGAAFQLCDNLKFIKFRGDTPPTFGNESVPLNSKVEVNSKSVAGAYEEALKKLGNNLAVVYFDNIGIKTQPTKITYEIGESFDPTGLVIASKYNDNSEIENIQYNETNKNQFGFSKINNLSVTDKSITITYKGKDTSQEITVNPTRYSVKKDTALNGEFEVDKTTAIEGDVVTINNVKPVTDYELDAVTATNGNGSRQTVSKSGDNYTFTMPAEEVTVAVTFKKIIHNFSNDFTIDKEATCTEKGEKSKHCNDFTNCGKKDEVTEIPVKGHSYGDWNTTKEATCTEDGTKEKICSLCSDKITETITKIGHDWKASNDFTIDKEATCTEKGEKSKHCKDFANCGKKNEVTEIPAKGHSYGDWNTTKEATCTEDGTKEKICSLCSDKITETITKIGHEWKVSNDFTIDKEATCTEKGEKSKHCKDFANCGKKNEVTEIPAKGHSYGDWNTTKETTCTEDGTKEKICSLCSDKITETITKIGHEWKVSNDFTIDKEATCTEKGEKSKHCKDFANCGKKNEVTEIPAKGHSYGDWNTTKEATCTEDGTKEKICSLCSDKITENITKVGHDWKEWTKVDDANHKRECANDVTHSETMNHSFDSGKVTAKATTEKEGIKTFTCKICSETKTETIAKLPLIIEGANSKWQEGSNNSLDFRSNAQLKDFIRVLIDGRVLDSKYYILIEGSTIIKLKPEYLATLSVGEHKIEIESITGIAESTFNIEGTKDGDKASYLPKTGGRLPIIPIAVGIVTIVSGLGLTLKKKY